MRSPADMKVIQIEITNACTKRCGNCTRFCGHHTKPFFMDLDTFRQAVDSLAGFGGVVGIMGGEPTIHPDFPRLVGYLRDHVGYDDHTRAAYAPTPDFLDHILNNAFNFNRGYNNQRGLWTSVSSKYGEHFELIQDTFGVQCVNDHSSPSEHTTLMATRAELGIPDEDWIRLRDNCWVQNNWSASITPKGAFFCEVAAAMDATLGGPGGWPIEPGWWKRTPKDFADQLHWCELCSACLPVPKRNANDETDDASPVWVEKLKGINSPKLRKGQVAEFDPVRYVAGDYTVTQGEQPYLSSNDQRIGVAQQMLVPKNIFAVLDVDDALPAAALRGLIEANRPAFGVHVLLSDNPEHHALAGELGIAVLPCADHSGEDLFAALKSAAGTRDWVLMLHGQVATEDLVAMVQTQVFNPGCFYSLRNRPTRPEFAVDLFNFRASALVGGGDLFALKANYAPRKVQFVLAPFAPLPKPDPVEAPAPAPAAQPAAPAVQTAPPFRIAVVTPYYKEASEILAECHDSVTAQSVPCTHFMVADGFPNTVVDGWGGVEHLALSRAHANNGNTPRAIGSMSAIAQGFDAIAYLDADNWFRSDHLERMLELHRSKGVSICTSNRTMHRLDGSILYCDLENDGVTFVDTSCFFLTRRAFRLAALWGMMPNQLSPLCDRIFWQAVQSSRLPRAHSREATVAFRTRYASHYAFAGEEPPPGAVSPEQFSRPARWWSEQPAQFRQEWDLYFTSGGW
ncbi:MAG: hypothetical protein RLZZ501_1654 [Pseudomonadota bacterium]|jgi:hypothetical protein